MNVSLSLQCPLCESVLKSDIEEHFHIFHKNEKTIDCWICKKKFFTLSGLGFHMLAMHQIFAYAKGSLSYNEKLMFTMSRQAFSVLSGRCKESLSVLCFQAFCERMQFNTAGFSSFMRKEDVAWRRIKMRYGLLPSMFRNMGVDFGKLQKLMKKNHKHSYRHFDYVLLFKKGKVLQTIPIFVELSYSYRRDLSRSKAKTSFITKVSKLGCVVLLLAFDVPHFFATNFQSLKITKAQFLSENLATDWVKTEWNFPSIILYQYSRRGCLSIKV